MQNTPQPLPLSIEPGDLPLVREAFQIQACTEMMCGRPGARQRLDALMGQLSSQIPSCANAFHGGDWAVICAVIKAGGKPEISIVAPDWNQYSRQGWIQIRLGDAKWRSHDCRYDADAPIIEEIRNYLLSL